MGLDPKDLDLFERIVQCEAGEDIFICRVAVAAVAMNRVRHPNFPNTIRGVLTQPYQFSPYHPLGITDKAIVDKDSKEAVRLALLGHDPTGGALFFYDHTMISRPAWSRGMARIITIGRVHFYKYGPRQRR